MTDIEKVLSELLKPHGFAKENEFFSKQTASLSNIDHNIALGINHDKIINITGTQITLNQHTVTTQNTWDTITIDLNHPNSLQNIEDWAKT